MKWVGWALYQILEIRQNWAKECILKTYTLPKAKYLGLEIGQLGQKQIYVIAQRLLDENYGLLFEGVDKS